MKDILQGRRRPHAVWDLVAIAVGCVLMALAFRLFMNGNEIVAGGVVGLSTILERATGIEPALTQWLVNLPLLGVAFLALGRAEGFRSLLGSLFLPLAIYVTRDLNLITRDLMLATVFGGLLYGAGLGLILSGRGSVGGYSLFARMLAKRTGFAVPSIIFAMDAATILGSAWRFGPEKAMFGLVTAFVMRRAIDGVLIGFTRSFLATIITNQVEPLRERILVEMDRGLTILDGTGGYSGEPRPVLMVVITQAEVPALRALVRDTDPDAFMVLAETHEVVGKGFRRE